MVGNHSTSEWEISVVCINKDMKLELQEKDTSFQRKIEPESRATLLMEAFLQQTKPIPILWLVLSMWQISCLFSWMLLSI